MDEKEINALIQLIKDPDEEIYQIVEASILKLGLEIYPALEEEWASSIEEPHNRRVEDLLESIQIEDVVSRLTVWKETGAQSLLEGACLFTNFEYYNLSVEELDDMLNDICDDAEDLMNDYLSNIEKIKILNHVFYRLKHISVNTLNLYSEENGYFNRLLEYGHGSPISISILYIIVAQRLELPVYGIDLPQNFLACYIDLFSSELKIGDDSFPSVLFYINTLNEGGILGKRDIDFYLRQNRLNASNSCYYPCDNVQIIRRLIEFQILCYENKGQAVKAANMVKLGKALGMDY